MAKLLFDFYSNLLENWNYEIQLKEINLNVSELFLNTLVILSILVIMFAVYHFLKWLIKTVISGFGWFD